MNDLQQHINQEGGRMKALIAVDGTEGSKCVLSVFKTMTREPESVILIHVQRSGRKSIINWPGRRGLDFPDPVPEKILSFYRKELENSGPVKVTTLVRDGIPSEEILRTAGEERVDFIIMGNSGKSGRRRPAAGRVAGEVERNATVPVLVAKTNRCKKFIEFKWRGKEYAA
jgi:nucleotide-binding universal stress UspA family protein